MILLFVTTFTAIFDCFSDDDDNDYFCNPNNDKSNDKSKHYDNCMFDIVHHTSSQNFHYSIIFIMFPPSYLYWALFHTTSNLLFSTLLYCTLFSSVLRFATHKLPTHLLPSFRSSLPHNLSQSFGRQG